MIYTVEVKTATLRLIPYIHLHSMLNKENSLQIFVLLRTSKASIFFEILQHCLRQDLSTHHFVFLPKCKSAFVLQFLPPEVQTKVLAKTQSDVVTHMVSSYQTCRGLGSIYTSVWQNCSVWCDGENKMFWRDKTCISG